MIGIEWVSKKQESKAFRIEDTVKSESATIKVLGIAFFWLSLAGVHSAGSENVSWHTLYDLSDTFTFYIEGSKSTDKIVLWILQPNQNLPYQEVLAEKIETSHESTTTRINDENQNCFLKIEMASVNPGEEVKVRLYYKVKVTQARFNVEGAYGDALTEDLKEFLKPEKKIESDHGAILSIAEYLKAGLEDPYDITGAIIDYIHEYYDYWKDGAIVEYDGKGALWTAMTTIGRCSELSYLFVALCRAAGVPARELRGLTFQWDEGEPGYHQWAEVYLDGTGWVPVDPTWNLGLEKRDNRIVSMDGKHIVCSRGNAASTMKGKRFCLGEKWINQKKVSFSLVPKSSIKLIESMFSDDFSYSKSGWKSCNDVDCEYGYKNGEYFIDVKEKDWKYWCWAPVEYSDLSYDVTVEVDAKLEESAGADGDFGIALYNGNDIYVFNISNRGMYKLEKKEYGTWVKDPVPWSSNPAINRGSRWNRLKVSVKDSCIEVAVNDFKLATVMEPDHERLSIGLAVGASNCPRARACFDNFICRYVLNEW